MDWMQIERQWEHINGQVLTTWPMLTRKDVRDIQGKKDSLIAKVTHLYGCERSDAEKQVERWASSVVLSPISGVRLVTRPKVGQKPTI